MKNKKYFKEKEIEKIKDYLHEIEMPRLRRNARNNRKSIIEEPTKKGKGKNKKEEVETVASGKGYFGGCRA